MAPCMSTDGERTMKSLKIAVALLALSAPAFADAHLTKGVTTKIDTKLNKVTIDHEELTSLDMPAMKMVFQVSDPALLEGLAEGATINFAAERINGKLTVTSIEEE